MVERTLDAFVHTVWELYFQSVKEKKFKERKKPVIKVRR